MGERGIGYRGMEWINVTYDMNQLKTLVNAVTKLRIALGNSRTREQLADSQEKLDPMELVRYYDSHKVDTVVVVSLSLMHCKLHIH